MDLTRSDEQRLLRESVDRFIAGTSNADHRRRVASELEANPEIGAGMQRIQAFFSSLRGANGSGLRPAR
jgi:hypothetical protein